MLHSHNIKQHVLPSQGISWPKDSLGKEIANQQQLTYVVEAVSKQAPLLCVAVKVGALASSAQPLQVRQS